LTGPFPSGHAPSRDFGTLRVTVVEARGLIGADLSLADRRKPTSDPYCMLRLGWGGRVIRSRTVYSTLEPKWNASVDFRLAACDEVLRIQVWDEDSLKWDDFLGSVELPLLSLHASPAPHRGWVALAGPSGSTGPAGALLLEMQLLDQRPLRHLVNFLAPLPAVPAPPPAFDPSAIYGPASHLVDLLWNRSLSPALSIFLGLLTWQNPLYSAAAIVMWNFAAMRLWPHWPAVLLLFLALYPLWRRASRGPAPNTTQLAKLAEPPPLEGLLKEELVNRRSSLFSHAAPIESSGLIDRQPAGTVAALERAKPSECGWKQSLEDEADDGRSEAKLSSSMQRLCWALPSCITQSCASIQPVLRSAADTAQLVHDIMVWRHPLSQAAVMSLLFLAALCEALCQVLCFTTLLAAAGTAALLACSPVVKVSSGLVAYMSWALSSRGPPKAWLMEPEYQPSWSSQDYLLHSTIAATA